MDSLFSSYESFLFFYIGANDRGYGHLAVTVTRDVPFAGAFAVVERQSECGSKDR